MDEDYDARNEHATNDEASPKDAKADDGRTSRLGRPIFYWGSPRCDKKLVDLQIKPAAVDPDDPEMLSDLVIAAVNDGLAQVDQATQAKLGKYTKGLGL